MTTVDKEYIMRSMLETLRSNVKYYRDVKTRELANWYLGELNGFGIFFNEVAARGTYVDETSKINSEFRDELETVKKFLVDKFASLE
jgi:hypothetical protein